MHLCFPDPYPDELLYSICARFSDRVRYPCVYTAVLSLFGYRRGRLAVTELPGHLSYFTSNLIQKDYYTVDNVIENHTVLPFYSPFLPNSGVEQIRSDMVGDRNDLIYPYTRKLKCGVILQKWLRFCPLCVEEDRMEFGECYWHRTHQISGIDVCVKHNVYLQNSTIPKQAKTSSYKFFSAEESVQVQPPIELDPSNSFDTVLLHIARSALWLIQQQGLAHNYCSSWRYEEEIFKQGWVHENGSVDTIDLSRMWREFEYRYNDKTLLYFCAAFDRLSGRIWPFRFVLHAERYHPVHHLLFIHFLGCKIEYFFAPVFVGTAIQKSNWC